MWGAPARCSCMALVLGPAQETHRESAQRKAYTMPLKRGACLVVWTWETSKRSRHAGSRKTQGGGSGARCVGWMTCSACNSSSTWQCAGADLLLKPIPAIVETIVQGKHILPETCHNHNEPTAPGVQHGIWGAVQGRIRVSCPGQPFTATCTHTGQTRRTPDTPGHPHYNKHQRMVCSMAFGELCRGRIRVSSPAQPCRVTCTPRMHADQTKPGDFSHTRVALRMHAAASAQATSVTPGLH
jgi:hypothetical protein